MKLDHKGLSDFTQTDFDDVRAFFVSTIFMLDLMNIFPLGPFEYVIRRKTVCSQNLREYESSMQ